MGALGGQHSCRRRTRETSERPALGTSRGDSRVTKEVLAISENISVSVSEKANVSGAAGNGSGHIYWVGGSKGGVGKSMMTLATMDHLLEQGANVLLAECDTSNPDVWKAYKEEVETELIDLDEADGWIHLVNTCDRRRDSVVVINTAARSNRAVKQYGSTLDSSLEELGRQLVALLVTNRQRDSLELLREFINAVPKAAAHVARNGYSARNEDSNSTMAPRSARR